MKKIFAYLIVVIAILFDSINYVSASNNWANNNVALPSERETGQFWASNQREFLAKIHNEPKDSIIRKTAEGCMKYLEVQHNLFSEIKLRNNLTPSEGIQYSQATMFLTDGNPKPAILYNIKSDLLTHQPYTDELKKLENHRLLKVFFDITHIIYFCEYLLKHTQNLSGQQISHPYSGTDSNSVPRFHAVLIGAKQSKFVKDINYLNTQFWKDIVNSADNPSKKTINVLSFPSAAVFSTSFVGPDNCSDEIRMVESVFNLEICEIIHDIIKKIDDVELQVSLSYLGGHESDKAKAIKQFWQTVRKIESELNERNEVDNIEEAGVGAMEKSRPRKKKKKNKGSGVKSANQSSTTDFSHKFTPSSSPFPRFTSSSENTSSASDQKTNNQQSVLQNYYCYISYGKQIDNIATFNRNELIRLITELSGKLVIEKNTGGLSFIHLSSKSSQDLSDKVEIKVKSAGKEKSVISPDMGIDSYIQQIITDQELDLTDDGLRWIFSDLLEKLFFLELEASLYEKVKRDEISLEAKTEDHEIYKNRESIIKQYHASTTYLHMCYHGLFSELFKIKSNSTLTSLISQREALPNISILCFDFDKPVNDSMSGYLTMLHFMKVKTIFRSKIMHETFPEYIDANLEKRTHISHDQKFMTISVSGIKAIIARGLPKGAKLDDYNRIAPLEKELKKEKARAAKEASSLKQQLSDLEQKVRNLSNETLGLESDKKVLNKQLEKSKKELKSSNASLASVSGKFAEVQATYVELSDKCEKLASKVVAFEKEKKVLQAKITELNNANARLEEAKSNSEKKNQQLTEDLAKSKKSIQSNQGLRASDQKLAEDLKAKLKTTSEDLLQSKRDLEDSSKKLASVENDKLLLGDKLNKLSKEIEDEHRSVEEYRKKIKELEAEIELIKAPSDKDVLIGQLQSDKDSISEQLRNANAQLKIMGDENSKLEQENKKFKNYLDRNSRRIKELEDLLLVEQKKSAQYYGNVQVYQDMNTQLQASNAYLQSAVVENQASRARLESELIAAQNGNQTTYVVPGPYGSHYLRIPDLIHYAAQMLNPQYIAPTQNEKNAQ